MHKKTIRKRIVQIAEETIGVYLTEEEPLKQCGVDSLSLVTLIVSIEETFGFSFSDSDLQPENLKFLSDLVRITKKYV